MPKPTPCTPSHAVDARSRISTNIKALRAERELSQEGLAELARSHRAYVSQCDRQRFTVSIGMVAEMMDAVHEMEVRK
jgi:transcriptional regulator with XRE-family HTH domain